MNTALEYSTKVVQEGGRRCKKSTLNDLVLTPLRIPLMNPPLGVCRCVNAGYAGSVDAEGPRSSPGLQIKTMEESAGPLRYKIQQTWDGQPLHHSTQVSY